MAPAVAVDPLVPLLCRIENTRRDTADTFTMELKPPDDENQFAFLPGQFNMLYVFGVGEVPISICGNPAEPNTIVHTTRAVGAVTKAMRMLRRGDTLGVRGPYGNCWPMSAAKGRDVVLIAGGIGLAPLRSVLYHLIGHREDYGKVVLLYGTRTPEEILYREELKRWRARFDLEVRVTVDRATGAWRGNIGVVTPLIGRSPFDPRNAVAMICGPEIMMRLAVWELQSRGVDTQRIYLSMERNMKCGVGTCGHCQFGPVFVCKDGPVFRYDQVEFLFNKREI